MSTASDAETTTRDEPIAIIGMAGRFPGAPDVETFWANLRDGVESIRRLSEEELLAAGVSRAQLADPNYVAAAPVLDDIDKFDASFFGFSPREASVMDPAHRIFLELAWAAVEHSGYTALPEEGPVGVFATAGAPLYMAENLHTNPDLMTSMGDFLVRHTGNDMNFLATRVSYEMDLRGPSLNIQTACSSTLVALHMACQSLRQGECTMALAGGATVLIPVGQGYVYKEGEILSPDGKCRPFDAKSAGTVFGSGAGVVVLKRLSDALDDGDTIHAVIKGSAINNDGAAKVGYLAPGVDGQAAVIKAALGSAGVSADSISYIETHGTGTLVGDPIEVEALNEAFRSQTQRRGFCAIGSVKSNIGHLGEAAASASLIKAIMALKHRQLPPSLGYETPNPAIDFDDSPFFVNDRLSDWAGIGPLRCGITALGAGGTNCHVILEEAPAALPGEGERNKHLLVLSAKSPAALEHMRTRLASALETNPSLDLADVAYTLALGRRALPYRCAFAANDHSEAVTRLRQPSAKDVASDRADDGRPTTIFMFPGGGAQYAGMGAELYDCEPVFRDAVDTSLAIADRILGRPLKQLIYPAAANAEAATRMLELPSLTLPALFITEYAMARLFQSWGLVPGALIGHSMGEYVAACLADVITLEEALGLVALRGKLFEQVPSGAMLSVPLGEAELLGLLPSGVDIAAANAPELTVASGPVAAIDELEAILARREIETTRIHINVAAHSAMLSPILAAFREHCRKISFQPPKIPIVSNVTGTWMTAAQATDPDYWVSHLRSTVRFAEGLQSIRSLGDVALLEVGPGRTLSSLARVQATPLRHVANSMRHPQETASDLSYALTSLGRLWAGGASIDWNAFYDGQLRNRLPLPAYPFERTSFWIAPGKSVARSSGEELSKRSDISDWFYGLGFAESPLVEAPRSAEPRRWLVLSEKPATVADLVRQLRPDSVVTVGAGRSLSRRDSATFQMNFDDPEQYSDLLQTLESSGDLPDHLVLVVTDRPKGFGAKDRSLTRNFLHPTYLVQALGGLSRPVQLSIVTTGLCDIAGEPIDPFRAVALGPIFSAPRELDHLRTRCIDIGPGPGHHSALVDELRAETSDRLVALRGSSRWVRRIFPMPLASRPESEMPGWIRDDGVYLITGGLGGIGLTIAGHLARHKRVRLALLSREGLPAEQHWDGILADGATSRIADRIRQVRSLRALGAEVLLPVADVANEAALRNALNKVRAIWGPLTGVIHAAGAMDDDPVMAKSTERMLDVLAPKVAGTLALDAAIHEPLDWFILISSVASFLGLAGQVDYTAANAFLDAFARARSTRARGRTLAINWNAWRDIGMAAASHRDLSGDAAPAYPSHHPAMDGFTDLGGRRLFVRDFDSQRDWLLNEHRVKNGPALLSGTTFVELARAVIAETHPGQSVMLSNVTFLSPFHVPDDENRRLTIEMTPSDGGYTITMRSDPALPPHVECEASLHHEPRPPALDLAAIAAACNTSRYAPADGFLAQDFMSFGRRWANIRDVRLGTLQALIELSLDTSFSPDLEAGYGLHPALLDMATGGVQKLIPGFDPNADFYVPLAYAKVMVYGPMPLRLFSHVRCRPDSGDGLAYFDVFLSDSRGEIFAEINQFTMKRLDRGSAFTTAPTIRSTAETSRQNALAAVLREAIKPDEGLQALDRIMAQPRLVQVIASSVDVELWGHQLEAEAITRGDQQRGLDGFERPDLATAFAPPESRLEKALAKMWCDLLGLQQVGVHDSFFDLGGNSLVAVRLFAAIKRESGISLPLATLFEASTIAELKQLLTERGAHDDASPANENAIVSELNARAIGPVWSPMVKIKAGSAGCTPLFCVHGAGGNVMNFRPLAQSLPADLPFYALQAQGIDGELPFHESIDDMATSYLEAILKVRPAGPYRLAGYSGGGIVALEMAQRLSRRGQDIELLVMFDSLAPAETQKHVTVREKLAAIREMELKNLVQFPAQRFKGWLHQRRIERAREGQGDATIDHLEIVSANAMDAFWRSQQLYEPESFVGDMVLYRAVKTGALFHRAGPTLGWNKVVSGNIDVIHLNAWHDTLFQSPSLEPLAKDLSRRILQLDAEHVRPPEKARQRA